MRIEPIRLGGVQRLEYDLDGGRPMAFLISFEVGKPIGLVPGSLGLKQPDDFRVEANYRHLFVLKIGFLDCLEQRRDDFFSALDLYEDLF